MLFRSLQRVGEVDLVLGLELGQLVRVVEHLLDRADGVLGGQRLVRTPDGSGRVATCEIMVMTGRVHDMIMDPTLTGQLPEVIAEGGYYGMQTFDQSLLTHVTAGDISVETALEVASSPHDFKLMLAAKGQRASGIEQVVG